MMPFSNGDANPISSFFEEDHQKLHLLFSEFQATKRDEPAVAAELFGRFTTGLLRHIGWEEQILFPLFEAAAGSAVGPTQVLRLEHGIIKELLNTIRSELADEIDSGEHEHMLLNVLTEHNWKEEHILYPAMDGQLTSEQFKELFAEIAASM